LHLSLPFFAAWAGVSLTKKVNEVARSQSLQGGEPQTSGRPQWRIAGWAESQT
jgi:hypothetical protein